jgi:hypothetical protein
LCILQSGLPGKLFRLLIGWVAHGRPSYLEKAGQFR